MFNYCLSVQPVLMHISEYIFKTFNIVLILRKNDFNILYSLRKPCLLCHC